MGGHAWWARENFVERLHHSVGHPIQNELGCRHLGNLIVTPGGFNLNAPPTLILVTTALTNLINNSAAVMLLLKVINLSHPPTAYILAMANSFGGSLIVIGSVSNIIVVQQAQQLGVTIGFREFSRLSIPVTLVALGGLLLWVIC
jgi:Na+/H+ antiporter NhaD/arsenite permease-like protein